MLCSLLLHRGKAWRQGHRGDPFLFTVFLHCIHTKTGNLPTILKTQSLWIKKRNSELTEELNSISYTDKISISLFFPPCFFLSAQIIITLFNTPLTCKTSALKTPHPNDLLVSLLQTPIRAFLKSLGRPPLCWWKIKQGREWRGGWREEEEEEEEGETFFF